MFLAALADLGPADRSGGTADESGGMADEDGGMAGRGGGMAGGGGDATGGDDLDPALAGQIRAWAQRSQTPHLSVRRLYLGLVAWSRLHGLISFELGHHLGATGIDPALGYDTEVQSLARLAA